MISHYSPFECIGPIFLGLFTLHNGTCVTENNKCGGEEPQGEGVIKNPNYGNGPTSWTYVDDPNVNVMSVGCTWKCDSQYIVNDDETGCIQMAKCNYTNKSNLRSNQKWCNSGNVVGGDNAPIMGINPDGSLYRSYQCKNNDSVVDCKKGTNYAFLHPPRWTGICDRSPYQEGCILEENVSISQGGVDYIKGIQYTFNVSTAQTGGPQKRIGISYSSCSGPNPCRYNFQGQLKFTGWDPDQIEGGKPVFRFADGGSSYKKIVCNYIMADGNEFLVAPYDDGYETKDIVIIPTNR